MSSSLPFLNERLAEAARYALMRRLLPAIRHNIAGSLQPIGMLSAMLERRMKAQAPDLLQLGKNADALHTLSREATATSLHLFAWLAPKDNAAVAVNSAVRECLDLVATELSCRGFSTPDQTTEVATLLPKGMLRSVFAASLIALTDASDGVASVVVRVEGEGDGTRLVIALEPGGTPALAEVGSGLPIYRALQWADVQAIADAERVALVYCARSVQLQNLAAPAGDAAKAADGSHP